VVSNNRSNSLSVVAYTLQRLADLGIDRVFGVPGDYSFPINDAVEENSQLTWVASANELNAAYAADGYARRRGAAILATTYGVGELSAINGVMGSLAEKLPVFHLVGAPSLRIVKQGLVAHHSLGDGVFGNFEPISAAACCVSARLSPENVVIELERLIDKALEESKPAYLLLPMDLAEMPIQGTPFRGSPISSIRQRQSDPTELRGALALVTQRINRAQNPVVIATRTLVRFGLRDLFEKFLEQTGLTYATAPMDRGVLTESHPAFLGVYSGEMSQPSELQQLIKNADLVLDIGGLITEDLNTGIWTDDVDPSKIINLRIDWVQSLTAVFTSVALQDMLEGLIEWHKDKDTAYPWHGKRLIQPLAPMTINAEGIEAMGSAYFYPLLQRFLRAGDVLVLEAGTCMLKIGPMKLPDGVDMENQTLWSSIGWATPAALGVALAETDRRVVLLSGDGAHQLTAQEIGVMGRHDINPVIIILNNGVYGVENMLSNRSHDYNILADWNYSELPNVMGCKNWWCGKASTVAELENAFTCISNHSGAAYLEVIIPAEESQPLPQELINRLQKQHTPANP
jgi:indolepyruvate decarboxylase